MGERQEGEFWDVSPAERRSPYVAFVPIIEGCNKFCSFCIVPYSRGREKSRSAVEIVADSGDFYRSSLIPLEGENAPRTTTIDFRGLPGGDYEVRIILLDPGGRPRATAVQSLDVISTK